MSDSVVLGYTVPEEKSGYHYIPETHFDADTIKGTLRAIALIKTGKNTGWIHMSYGVWITLNCCVNCTRSLSEDFDVKIEQHAFIKKIDGVHTVKAVGERLSDFDKSLRKMYYFEKHGWVDYSQVTKVEVES